jgi:hypothetical protein
LLALPLHAQEPRRPEAELKNLDYFAGSWTTTGSVVASPMGKGGPVSGTDRNEWQKGRFFLVGHVDYATPSGQGTQLTVYGYDAGRKVYTFESFTSDGEHEVATGTFDNNTWTWTSDDSNAQFKWRYVQKVISPSSFSSSFEFSQDGANWTTAFRSSSRRQ